MSIGYEKIGEHFYRVWDDVHLIGTVHITYRRKWHATTTAGKNRGVYRTRKDAAKKLQKSK